MEKDYGLQCIDYAVAMTKARANQAENLKKLDSVGHLSTAIIEYMFNGNAKGFTSFGEGRKYILGLTKEDFEEQLLKHVVKSECAKTRNGIVQRMGTNKKFGEDLDNSDVQLLIYGALGEMDMTRIKYILDKYPTLYSALTTNFIEDRFFNYKLGEVELDKPMNNYQNNYYYSKIDEFYKELRNSRTDTIKK